jgi:hypothetical protein
MAKQIAIGKPDWRKERKSSNWLHQPDGLTDDTTADMAEADAEATRGACPRGKQSSALALAPPPYRRRVEEEEDARRERVRGSFTRSTPRVYSGASLLFDPGATTITTGAAAVKTTH